MDRDTHKDASERTLTIAPGDYSDVCSLCGIHRQNAGFLRETCGEHYLKPGCFVIPAVKKGLVLR